MHLEHRETDSVDPRVRQLVAEAARQPQLLLDVLDTIDDRVYLKDDLGRITFVNQAYLRAFGLSASEVIGKSHPDFLSAEMVSACHDSDQKVLQQGEQVCLETHWQDSDTGTHHWSESHKSPLRDAAGKVIGIVGICRDVTARHSAEEELKRNESLLLHASRLSSLGELAAGIAHEVNQPLFSILNYAKAIENKLQDEGELDVEAIRMWVKQIYSEASRGGKITQRLKSFVKPTESQRKSSDINEIVRESLGFMRIEFRDAGIVIETELTESLPSVVVDRIQIQQVLVNLLKNAIEALSSYATDNPRVVVSTRFGSSRVEVAVADNGPGVSSAVDVNILDPFQTTKPSGVGLGLAICKTIIDTHEGQLAFHQNDGGGATFCFALPVALPDVALPDTEEELLFTETEREVP